MSERGPPSRGFLQFPAEGNSSIRLLYVGESPELLGSWSTVLEVGSQQLQPETTLLKA